MSNAPNPNVTRPQRVLVVGLGTMGMSHARAYQAIDGFELVGLCTRNAAARSDLDKEFAGIPRFDDLTEALKALKPDAVSINTYTEHHAPMALEALAAGAHVFCEKPLADSLEAAEALVAAARKASKALLVGYILRVHPSWTRFVEIGRTLGKPLVMRMNLNQQSSGSFWQVHKPDALDLADRRLRRPLCRHHVPGDADEAGRRACGRRAAHRRDRADNGQLRTSPSFLR
jgi:predicted dehydrogenase